MSRPSDQAEILIFLSCYRYQSERRLKSLGYQIPRTARGSLLVKVERISQGRRLSRLRGFAPIRTFSFTESPWMNAGLPTYLMERPEPWTSRDSERKQDYHSCCALLCLRGVGWLRASGSQSSSSSLIPSCDVSYSRGSGCVCMRMMCHGKLSPVMEDLT